MSLDAWARLEAIYAGCWARWQPKPVRLSLFRFIGTDHEGQPHWFDVIKGQWIQGLVARAGLERRVYIVTIIPEREDATFARWPRLVAGRDKRYGNA